MFYLVHDFPPLQSYGTEYPHMTDTGLNLQSHGNRRRRGRQNALIGRTSILNDEDMVASGHEICWVNFQKIHATGPSQRKL